jgi:hypothetical protein
VYDEQALARVLEAAYILQEHRGDLQKLASKHGLTLVPPAERKPKAAAAPRTSQSLPQEVSQINGEPNLLEALEKLQAGPAAMAKAVPSKDSLAKNEVPAIPAAKPPFTCRKCGHELMGEEQFCGNCGTARSGDYEPPTMQSKVATLWLMQQTSKQTAAAASSGGVTTPEAGRHHSVGGPAHSDVEGDDLPDLFSMPEIKRALAALNEAEAPTIHAAEAQTDTAEVAEPQSAAEITELARQDDDISHTDAPVTETALTRSEPGDPWTSAANARVFLEQLAASTHKSAVSRFWNARRGDIYLAIAVILVGVVIRWGIWSDHAASAKEGSAGATASHRRQPDPNADLSLVDRMLIGLGIAEAPDRPEYKGNPDTQVWVDTHTALYYCPGADLYGKTPQGKFTSQRDAQLDQFEPAFRRACD